jgi:eukaryotic-like serine/threonine-protein kinase
MIGQTISHFRILEKIGEGGMGVVYKAQDTALERFVALKFLPPHLNASVADKARFVQEAKAASAINHPNICTIYSIEENENQVFIAMELVEGHTLQEKKESYTLKQALDIGIQIAEGLAAAHDRGIVHRDVKPENIMIRKDGRVQIMDFGLAKLKGISRLTKEGSTVGTAGFMSPEQVQGLDTDHRSDIFSLGVLLFELFAHQLPFKGVHETAIAYEIVNVDSPPMSSINPEIPPELDALVLECLEKDPQERTQSAAQVAIDLKRYRRQSSRQRMSRIAAAPVIPKRPQSPVSQGQPDGQQTATPQSRSGSVLPWVAAGIGVLGMIAFGLTLFLSSNTERKVIRASLPAPAKSNLFLYGNEAGPATLSPDGQRLAFAAADSSGKRYLYVWSLDSNVPRLLAGTEGAVHPFWSPDNRFIGFFSQTKLKKIDASGGEPLTICQARNPRGGAWNNEGTIIFSPGPANALVTVPASGGVPTPLTKLDLAHKVNSHRWPSFLPDGKHFLYFARTTASGIQSEGDAICVASLDGKDDKILVRAASNAQYASGFLLYARGASLIAQRFDDGSLELKGEPVTIAEGVAFDESTLHSLFTVSQTGILIYQTGSVQIGSSLNLFDRGGKRIGGIGDRAEYLQPRWSFDNKHVAVDIYNFQSHNIDLWVFDVERNSKTRFTFAPSYEQYPLWSHDGSRIFFNANPQGIFDLYSKSSSGAGSDELLLQSAEDKIPLDVSEDGKFLLYQSNGGPKTQSDLLILPLGSGQPGKDRTPIPFLQTEFNETDGRFSPDGKWIAYVSNEAGQNEIWLRSYPSSGSRWQVSIAGGAAPRWRRDGKELYYQSPTNMIMAATITYKSATIEVSNVHPLFEVPLLVQLLFPGYDVSADGTRFLVNVMSEVQNQTPLSLVLNWDLLAKKK